MAAVRSCAPRCIGCPRQTRRHHFLPIHSPKKTKGTKNFVSFVFFCGENPRSILPSDFMRKELCRRIYLACVGGLASVENVPELTLEKHIRVTRPV
jgi:hypothetical protein